MPILDRDIRILTLLVEVEVEIVGNRIRSFVLKLKIDSILVNPIIKNFNYSSEFTQK